MMLIWILPAATLHVNASTLRTSVRSSSPWYYILLPIVGAIVGAVLKYNNKKKKHSDNPFIDSMLKTRPLDQEGLSDEEIRMLAMYQSEVRAKKPKPVSINCPNCGAPVTLSDKAVCPYCRSEVKNLNARPADPSERKKIEPKDYNPRRYYEENETGYEDNIDWNNPSYHDDQQPFNSYSQSDNDYRQHTTGGVLPDLENNDFDSWIYR